MKKVFLVLLVFSLILSGCNKADSKTELNVFIAASLNSVMTDIADEYTKENPDVDIIFNADSSGKLLTQIEEGYDCDIFFSAAQKQMDKLQSYGLVVEGTRKNVVGNKLVVIALKNSNTEVTGLDDINKAESIALAGGSVPAGKYTREAMVNLGILPKVDDVSAITTEKISKALGNVEISEQDNVSKVLTAVVQGACQVGTTYYTDIYGYEDELTVLETVDESLTGEVTYPLCIVENSERTDKQREAAEDFVAFITSEKAKEIFESYYFDTDID